MIQRKAIFWAVLLPAFLLPACENKEAASSQAENTAPKREPSRSEIPTEESGVITTGDPATDYDPSKDYKNKKGLAMDRTPEVQKALTAPPPAWLSFGKDIHPEFAEGKSTEIDWMVENTFNEQKAPHRVSIDGKTTPGNEVRWSRAILSPSGGKALFVPMDYLEGSNVFNIVEGEIDEQSGQAIPSINYDDPRRWTIGWKHFLSKSTIVGTVNEEDFSGHTTVRSSIYTYDLQTKTLSRIKVPDAIQQTLNNGINIEAVSEFAILVSSDNGYYTIVLK